MEYPFKDLMPLDEVLEREGYYRDWTHLDPETFYSITQISEMIKTKGYGTDVRLLISQLAEHFGLSVVEVTDIANDLIARQDKVEQFNTQTIQEMTDKDVISAPELIESRKGEKKLSIRLDKEYNEVTAQLAQTEIKKLNRNENESIGMGMLAPDIKEALNSGVWDVNVNTSDIEAGAITPRTTNFAQSGGGINILTEQLSTLTMNGNAPYVVASVEGLSYLEEVEPNTTYTIWKSDDSDRFRIGFFADKPVVGSVPSHHMRLDYADNPTLNKTQYTYTTNSTDKYILIHVSTTGANKLPSQLQIEKGSQRSEYVSPKVLKIPLHKTSIPEINPDMVSFTQQSEKNLFDGNYYIGYLHGLAPHAFTGGNGKHAIVQVPSNTPISISKSTDTSRMLIGGFPTIPKIGDEPTQFYNTQDSKLTIQTNATTKYLMVVPSGLSENKAPEWLQVEVGNYVTSYEEPKTIRKSMIPSYNLSAQQTNFVIRGGLNGEYVPETTAPVTDASLNLAKVYETFDSLVSDFPDYVTRNLLTNETSGLPVYYYTFKSATTGNYSEKLPTVLHVNGIHGSEKESLASGMRFYNDLCRNWKASDRLQKLRWNTNFIVVPAFNAWGVENNRRSNVNDVDLNRDFPVAWEFSDTPNNKSGIAPLSQPESQALMNLIETEKENIIFALDHHRYNPYAQDGYTMWTGTRNDTMNKYLASWSRDMQGEFAKAHPELAVGNVNRIRVNDVYAKSRSGWLAYTFIDKGFAGTILEISLNPELNDFHTMALGDLINYAVEELHNNKNKWLD